MLDHTDYTPQPRDRAPYIPSGWDTKPPLTVADRIAASATIACIVALGTFGAVIAYAWWMPPGQ